MSASEWECRPDSHHWLRADGFRFCTVCDREEHDSGLVRAGWQNFREPGEPGRTPESIQRSLDFLDRRETDLMRELGRVSRLTD